MTLRCCNLIYVYHARTAIYGSYVDMLILLNSQFPSCIYITGKEITVWDKADFLFSVSNTHRQCGSNKIELLDCCSHNNRNYDFIDGCLLLSYWPSVQYSIMGIWVLSTCSQQQCWTEYTQGSDHICPAAENGRSSSDWKISQWFKSSRIPCNCLLHYWQRYSTLLFCFKATRSTKL